jgi:hypothetical protein
MDPEQKKENNKKIERKTIQIWLDPDIFGRIRKSGAESGS